MFHPGVTITGVYHGNNNRAYMIPDNPLGSTLTDPSGLFASTVPWNETCDANPGGCLIVCTPWINGMTGLGCQLDIECHEFTLCGGNPASVSRPPAAEVPPAGQPPLGGKGQRQQVSCTGKGLGPQDPTDPTQPLYKNKAFQKKAALAWEATNNGQGRGGWAEAGFVVQYENGRLTFGQVKTSMHSSGPPNELRFSVDTSVDIAIFHTHGNSAVPTPSPDDRSPTLKVPDFVRSQDALYVVMPHTATGNPPLDQCVKLPK